MAAQGSLDPLIGARLRGGVLIDALIARGSFGAVYRGHQLDVGRDVAVKVLDPAFGPDDPAGRLFRDEIRAIGNIGHRGVVHVYHSDVTPDGRLCFVMELLRGPTLHQLAEAGPLPVPRALGLVTQLLDGLVAVHRAGHIHADVKPSNAIVVADSEHERVVLIDFGLSRLRSSDQPVEAVGGTRAYMAPEQIAAWQVGARSDVYSAALVLLRLITGWERRDDGEPPPLDRIADPAVRCALERATARDPAVRPAAADLARALRGGAADEPAGPGPRPPFRHLAPMTAHDRGRLHGREAHVLRVFRALDPARPVILVAPSGTGKTSLLCAGVVPYLDANAIDHVYLACRPGGGAAALAAARSAGSVARGRPVLILDQVESLLGDPGEAAAVLGELLDRRPGDGAGDRASSVAILLAVREDFVARLIAASDVLSAGVPQLRLPPLDRDGASAALVAPLVEHGVELAPGLVTAVLDDLIRAGGEVGERFGWDAGPAVYPPHLQLLGEALWNARGPRDAVLTIEHYHRTGGLDAIVTEHLDRKLAALAEPDRAIARDLFLSLVTAAQTRVVRAETELLDALASRHRGDAVHRVLARLETARLVLRRAAADGAVTWELLHDSLVPHIEAWLDLHDAERRRAAEVIRFHLLQSRSRGEDPALLSARELRRVDRFPGLIDELEREWARRPAAAWTPRSLTARSRHALRIRRGAAAVGALGALALAALLVARWRQAAHEAELEDRDLGRIELAVTVFDWRDRGELGWEAVPVDLAALPALAWSLHDPAPDDRDSAGAILPADRVRRGRIELAGGARVETDLDVRGGDAFLVVTGRGRAGEACAPSIIPLSHLPGYANRGHPPPRRAISVPSCRASWFDTVEIPAGEFIYGGKGEPPSHLPDGDLPVEERIELAGYRIDRAEVTNPAYQVFAAMARDAAPHSYPVRLARASGPRYPRTDLDWFDARAYCRFMGKDLPTSRQWQKALRGGLMLRDGPNPHPRRNFPWGTASVAPDAAAIAYLGVCETSALPCAPAPVSARDRPLADRSPYGVDDLAGVVQEWVADAEPGSDAIAFARRPRLTRGGNWANATRDSLVDYMAAENTRDAVARAFHLGVRCALGDAPPGPGDSLPVRQLGAGQR